MKEFAMLTATQRLTQYFLREFGRLDAAEVIHQNNSAVQKERLIRIDEVNELSDTLNELFGTLTGSPGSKLFPSYGEQKAVVEKTGWLHSAESVDVQRGESVVSENPDQENAKQDQLSQTLEANDMLSPAQKRADQILKEHSETAPRDISRHLPEHDRPFEVLPRTMLSATLRAEESGENNDLSHSDEGVPLDGNATQIANVQTVVEKADEEARRGTDIALDEYLTRGSNQLVTGLIEEDIRKLRTGYIEGRQAIVAE